MTGLKAIGAHLVVMLAALTIYFGLAYTFGYAAGTDAAVLEPWLWAWAGTASLSLAVTLATFCIEISDYLAALWTPTPRGRHAR